MESFSIACKVDYYKLSVKIDEWYDCHDYSPIVLMSRETFDELNCVSTYGLELELSYDRFGDNKIHRVIPKSFYRDSKIFIDDSMEFGMVTIR